MQGGEPEFHLCLSPRHTNHMAVRRSLRHVLKERCFAHTGLAVDDQCPAGTPPDIVQEPVQNPLLSVAADEACGVAPDRGSRWVLHRAKGRSQLGFLRGEGRQLRHGALEAKRARLEDDIPRS